MKRLILLGIISTIFFYSCQKDDTIYQSYFWTPLDSSNVQLDLYIDGQFKGPVPFLTQNPDCNNDSSLIGLTPVPLKLGTYDIQVKDEQGNTQFSARMKIKKGGAITVTEIAGELNLNMYGDYDCFYFEMVAED